MRTGSHILSMGGGFRLGCPLLSNCVRISRLFLSQPFLGRLRARGRTPAESSHFSHQGLTGVCLACLGARGVPPAEPRLRAPRLQSQPSPIKRLAGRFMLKFAMRHSLACARRAFILAFPYKWGKDLSLAIRAWFGMDAHSSLWTRGDFRKILGGRGHLDSRFRGNDGGESGE